MSTQDSITQLALAVLRSAPRAIARESGYFMQPLDRPKAVAILSGPAEKSERSANFPTAWPFARREVWI